MSTEQQVAALNSALMTAQQHTAQLSQEIEQVKADSLKALDAARADKAELEVALAVLRRDSEAALNTLQHRMQNMDGASRRDGYAGLLNLKHFEPKTFTGKDSDDIKPWAKKMKAYCNAKKAVNP